MPAQIGATIDKFEKGGAMSEFSINITKVESVTTEQERLVKRLKHFENRIADVKKNVNVGTNTLAMRTSMTWIVQETRTEWKALFNMTRGLESAKSIYQNKEKELTNLDRSTKLEYDGFGSVVVDAVNEIFNWKNLWKAVGKAGAVGGFVGTVGKFLVSDAKMSDWASFVTDGISGLWKLGKDAVESGKNGSVKANWREFIGFDAYEPKDFGEAIGEYFGPNFKVEKSAELVFSGIVNGFLNYEEFKEKYDNGEVSQEYAIGRGAAEVVCETAVGWATGMLVKSAVSSVVCGVAGAVFGVAAPVIVVGAATVVVTAGVDWVCKKITGNGLTETVSDFILDSAENIGKAVSSTASAAWSGLKDGWKNLTSGKTKFKFAF